MFWSEASLQNDINVGEGDDVNVITGNMYLSFKDLSVNGTKDTLEIVRTYNSQTDYRGYFGDNWSSTYNIYIDNTNSDYIILHDEYGAERKFIKNQNGSYTAEPGNYSSLVKNPDGSYLLTKKNGVVT